MGLVWIAILGLQRDSDEVEMLYGWNGGTTEVSVRSIGSVVFHSDAANDHGA